MARKIIMLSCIFLLIFISIHTLSAGQLGININFAERGGTFVDVVKEGYRWSNMTDGKQLTMAQVDQRGWPKVDAVYIVDYRPVAEWSGSIDDPDVYRINVSGTYKCSFAGSAEVRGVSGGKVKNKKYNASLNRTTFDFTVPGFSGKDYGLFVIGFTKTKRSSSSAVGSGLTSFKMLRPGYKLSTNQIFTNKFIAAITGIKFSVIRFMNFTLTNGCDPVYPGVTKWSNRKHKDDASQNCIPQLGKNDGASWEYVIELCNIAKMDPWINIPVSADSGYIWALAELLKSKLDHRRRIYIESSNEVWNTAPGFEQSLYNKAQAENFGISEYENHARRTIKIVKIFAIVFGREEINNKIRVILCSHRPMLKWWVMPMFDFISKKIGNPSNYIYAIACQTYFGSDLMKGKSVDNILADCKSSIIKNINEPGESGGSGRKQWVKFAKDKGLVGGFCSYEGGPDHGGGDVTNISNRIKAERDPRMAEILTFNYDNAFFQIGGNLAMQFTLSSAYSRYGCWGLTDDISRPNRNSKYKAAKVLAEKYSVKLHLADK